MVSNRVRGALLASQIHRQQNELELWTTLAAGNFAPRVDFPAAYSGRVYWEFNGILYPATSGAAISAPAVGGMQRAVLKGVPLSALTRLDANTSGLVGDITTLRLDRFRSNLAYLHLASTGVSGDISNLAGLSNLATLYLYSTDVSGDISNLAGLSELAYLALHSTGVSGDISNLVGLSKLTYLHLASTGVSGDISNLAGLSNLATLYLYSTSATCGSTFTASWVGMQKFQVQNCLMSQAAVGNVVESIWNARATFTYATPELNVGGTNAAPAGTVAAPPGGEASNSDWSWDGAKYIPLTAGAMIWDLAKDVNSEEFNKWAITYAGGSI